MNEKEPTQIESVGDFIKWVVQLGPENYLFRGVPNAAYRIQASAYRRPKEGTRDFEKFLQINRDLIAEARLRGHGEKEGRKLGDLEILAQLQHYGAATCLVDFTHNAQIALYFACQPDLKQEGNSQNSEKPPDGKVYAVRNDPDRFEKVTPDSLEKKIDDFFQSHESGRPQLYHWEPAYHNNRIIAQQSIFLFGVHQFDEDSACIIVENSKENILSELERVSRINQSMLFPDFDGFARLHSEGIPYTILSSSDYRERALLALSENRYEDAIANFDTAIKLSPKNSELYRRRGAAKKEIKQYEDATADFDTAIEMNSDDWMAYYLRGKTKYDLDEYEDAITDFDTAIEIDSQIPLIYYWRGMAKYKLDRYEDAIADFDTAIEINSQISSVYYWRGRAKHNLYEYEDAIADYSASIRLKPNPHSYRWRALAKKEIQEFVSTREDLQSALILANEVRNADLIAQISQDISEISGGYATEDNIYATEDDIPF